MSMREIIVNCCLIDVLNTLSRLEREYNEWTVEPELRQLGLEYRIIFEGNLEPIYDEFPPSYFSVDYDEDLPLLFYIPSKYGKNWPVL